MSRVVCSGILKYMPFTLVSKFYADLSDTNCYATERNIEGVLHQIGHTLWSVARDGAD